MGELYRHLEPGLTGEQEQNLKATGRYLVETSRRPEWEPRYFDVGSTAYDLESGDDVPPQAVADFPRKLLKGALGHAPLAGFPPLPTETWHGYQQRIFGASFDSPLEWWLFSASWRSTDNTPVGAALRMSYVLDYGVPNDFVAISRGEAPSDYADNGFLWERLRLLP